MTAEQHLEQIRDIVLGKHTYCSQEEWEEHIREAVSLASEDCL